jgi:poly(3-hydroxybutyrate) depolymerase
MPRRHVVSALAALLASIGGGPVLRAAPPKPSDLHEQLRTFLTHESARERKAARQAILECPDLDHPALETALRTVALWDDAKPDENPLHLTLGEDDPYKLDVYLRVPPAYSPDRAWPLLITLHGTNDNATNWLAHTAAMLGPKADEFIIAAPQDLKAPSFNQPADLEMRPRLLLRELRRRFRIDNDRVFMTGYSLGGHQTFLCAAMHADMLAGAMPLSGALVLPLNDLLFEPVLPCAANLPVLAVWGEHDVEFGITPRNRPVRDLAARLNMTRFTGIELAGIGHLGVAPPADKLAAWLGSTRARYPKHVRSAFRLAELSQAYWVRTTRLQGKPMPSDEVRVKIEDGETQAQALLRYIEKNLGVIEGRVDGQTIMLETHKSTYVELLLHDDLISISKPIKVLRHDRETFNGIVPRDLGITLDAAAETWDFERLPRAMLRVPVGGKAKPVKSKP